VGQEGIPLGVGRSTVFLAGPGGPAAGDERPVRLDRLGGVDGLWPIVVSMFLCPQMTWAICGGSPLMMASVPKIRLLSALSVFGLTRVAIDMAFIL
jgi:hypothetical protein